MGMAITNTLRQLSLPLPPSTPFLVGKIDHIFLILGNEYDIVSNFCLRYPLNIIGQGTTLSKQTALGLRTGCHVGEEIVVKQMN